MSKPKIRRKYQTLISDRRKYVATKKLEEVSKKQIPTEGSMSPQKFGGSIEILNSDRSKYVATNNLKEVSQN